MSDRQRFAADTRGRTAILDRLHSRPVAAPRLPDPDHARMTRFDDPLEVFRQRLQSVGGEAHLIDHPREVADALNTLSAFRTASQVASTVPDAVAGNFDVASVEDPHALASLDWMIAGGEFVVAENGAIWVDGAKLPHRALLFIAQYLAIVVRRDQIVSNMHEAYARIPTPSSPFGIFVSGPSKTADIEQSLVLGAHGCRKLQVFLTR